MSAHPGARPFPWTALESLSREDVLALRQVRRWASAYVDLTRLSRVLGEILDVPVQVLLRRACALATPTPIPGGAGVLLAPADTPTITRGALVEADRALVARTLQGVLRRAPRFAVDPESPLPPGAFGTLASVVVAAARRAHSGVALRLLAAGPARSLEADLARSGLPLVSLSLTVLVGDDAFEARVVMPRDVAAAAPEPPWRLETLRAMGSVPLAVPLVAVAVGLTTLEVGRLSRGDALLLPDWPLAATPAGLTGPVIVAPPTAPSGVRAHLRADGGLVLGGELGRLCAAEDLMGDIVGREELVASMGDVPVVLRVEIGEASMPAREWATLGPGDVVTLGRRIAEPVVLRVGGVALARGELVEVDGRVAVRILERTTGPEVTR